MTEPRRDQVAQFMEQGGESSKEDDGEYWEHGETAGRTKRAKQSIDKRRASFRCAFFEEFGLKSFGGDEICEASTAKNCRLCAWLAQRKKALQNGAPFASRAKTEIRLFTLAVTAVAAEIATAGVFELTVTLGTDADHVRHDCAGDGLLSAVILRLLFADCAS
jgi:hypothetical protein